MLLGFFDPDDGDDEFSRYANFEADGERARTRPFDPRACPEPGRVFAFARFSGGPVGSLVLPFRRVAADGEYRPAFPEFLVVLDDRCVHLYAMTDPPSYAYSGTTMLREGDHFSADRRAGTYGIVINDFRDASASSHGDEAASSHGDEAA